jgi:hypothetical protein
LFAPALSPDGKTIAAVKISTANKISIIEIETESGQLLKEYQNPSNLMLQAPAYNQTGNKLIFSAVSQQGKTICEINRQTGEFLQLFPFQSQLISNPGYADDQIIFSAHFNGLDNIYRFDPATSKIFQLTSAQYGAFNPTYDSESKQIFFNSYQVTGNDIASFGYDENVGTEISKLDNTFIDYAKPLAIQEGNKNVFDSLPGKTFESRRFREFNNLFYFHSLAPIAKNIDINSDPTLGLEIKSNNKLNTLDFYSGYQYNTSLKKSEYLAGFTYKRYYPVLSMRYINRARLAYSRKQVDNRPVFTPVTWRENFTELEISVPFVFNQLNKIYSMGLRTSTSYTSRYDIQNKPAKFNTNLQFPIKYQAYLNRNTRRSPRDLASRWGQNFTFTYQHFPFEENIKGDLFTVRSLFFTPGILPHHSLQTSFNYQLNSGAYNQMDNIPLISGYNNLTPTKELSNTLLFDYRFPIFYPDWEIGPLAYIKRFKGGFFADFEKRLFFAPDVRPGIAC